MTAGPRCYTTAQLLDILTMPRTTFFTLKQAGKLPFLEELKPRIGRCARYRADLVDRYLQGTWTRTVVPQRRAG
jgi:hypothetical protein